MRSTLFRAFLAAALFSTTPLPAFAAETFKVPFTVVPGSAIFQTDGGTAFPISLPYSALISQSCDSGVGTFTIEEVNGGLELGLDGQAFPSTGACRLQGEVLLEIEVNVPEVGGSSTDVYMVHTTPVFDFTQLSTVLSLAAANSTNNVSTTLGPGVSFAAGIGSQQTWSGPASNVVLEGSQIGLHPWIPGDTLRIPFTTLLQFNAISGSPTIGEIKVRYELKVTVPEPSAALSLPIGALTLAGLSMMKGGA